MPTFPGLYRAKVVKVETAKVTAQIPQVYGEASVVITDFTGSLPALGMGWVMFQAGEPSRPVWVGGGGGGGTGTVTDTLWVGPDAPTDTSIEMWWDTDDTVDLDPRYALGVVAFASVTANQTPITTMTDLTGLSVTFVAEASRYYRVTGVTLPSSTVAQDVVTVVAANAANTPYGQGQTRLVNITYGETVSTSAIFTGVSGSTTVKLRMQRVGTGTITNNAGVGYPSFICVEDIGSP